MNQVFLKRQKKETPNIGSSINQSLLQQQQKYKNKKKKKEKKGNSRYWKLY